MMAYTLGFTREVFGFVSAAWKGVWRPKIGMVMVMVGIELAMIFLMNTHGYLHLCLPLLPSNELQ